MTLEPNLPDLPKRVRDAIADLSAAFAAGLTLLAFDSWRYRWLENLEFVDVAYGTIQWKRSVGQLMKPYARNFEVETTVHVYRKELDAITGREVHIHADLPLQPARIWDGPEDETWSRVNFMSASLEIGENYTIRPNFSRLAKWEPPGQQAAWHGPRGFDPAVIGFTKTEGTVHLDPIEVRWARLLT